MGAVTLGLAWRHHAANGITWRLATEADLPRLHELWGEMDRRLGKQDRPNLFDVPVVLTLVAENETGDIVSGFYGEAIVDWTGIGTNREAARTIPELLPTLRDFLFARGIRVTQVHVPKRVAAGMARVLPWMADVSQRFALFTYTVRL